MYVPDEYRAPDGSWASELIRRHPLALLSTNGAGTPCATHCPVIFRPGQDLRDLTGTVLIGHMNRMNPHWAALAETDRALIVFAGPHGYVSPCVYGRTPAAPTWDFTCVHVRGTIRPLHGDDATIGVVGATVRTFEADFPRQRRGPAPAPRRPHDRGQ